MLARNGEYNCMAICDENDEEREKLPEGCGGEAKAQRVNFVYKLKI